jgi:outer membrane protein assembly factor BamB
VACLDLKTGKPRWIYPLAEPVMSEPVAGDVNGDGIPDIIVGTMERRLHCLSGKGDASLWSYAVGAQIRYCAPALVWPAEATGAPVVFAGTGPPENGLYCLTSAGPRPTDRGWFGPWKSLTSPH